MLTVLLRILKGCLRIGLSTPLLCQSCLFLSPFIPIFKLAVLPGDLIRRHKLLHHSINQVIIDENLGDGFSCAGARRPKVLTSATSFLRGYCAAPFLTKSFFLLSLHFTPRAEMTFDG